MKSVLGLDLSLTSAGACVILPGWTPGAWGINHLRTMTVGYALKEATQAQKVERISDIANALCEFAYENDVTHAFVEDYAYGLAGRGGMMQAELGGALKFLFFSRLQMVVQPVNISTVRKYLFGTMPKKDKKTATGTLLKSIGCPFETSDERDAFVVANYGRSEVGLPGLSVG